MQYRGHPSSLFPSKNGKSCNRKASNFYSPAPCATNAPKVTGTVDFDGHELLSPSINFSTGGGVNGLHELSVGDAGLKVSGMIHAVSDVVVEGSVTVAGAVMGRGPYMDTSDGRLKTNVKEISATEASSVVQGLRRVGVLCIIYRCRDNVSGMCVLGRMPYVHRSYASFGGVSEHRVAYFFLTVPRHSFLGEAYRT